ncbi:EAL domain-containing protein [Nitrogeniibacter mangrovi]|uniref:EAL domain-containing protein n=1 Tax=Nitrogeniibacter mangrovi TaxID=2016596 RepID=A0A6C1B2N7_9RHOO|nr:EAL domain-containing protein [Nitrogeniibacter mangrovi]QID17098.1 EAL domain-containing protein [Nitrogeniibacter mangrovi]
MSLIKQLWIATLVLTLGAFGCSFVISTLSARDYLERELGIKNRDNANVLALAMTQLPKDAATVELLVAAQFDNAHYDLIRLTDPTGEHVIVERSHENEANAPRGLGLSAEGPVAPAWFRQLIPMHPEPGRAFVSDGWQPFGTLTVKTHTGIAYDSLWQSTLRLLEWFLAGAVLVGLLGTVLLRWLLRPLDAVVAQARAIGARRFVTVPAPATPEFATVVGAMNTLSDQVHAMLEEESIRLEHLRRAAQHDPISGLPNREHFMAQASATLDNDSAPAVGTLAIVRLSHLIALNEELGRSAADELLRKLAGGIETLTDGDGMLAGRLNGTDFALLAPNEDQPEALAARLAECMDLVVGTSLPAGRNALPIGVACYHRGDPLPQLLAHADVALTRSEAQEGAPPQIERVNVSARPATDLGSWRNLISEALAMGRFSLVQFPVIDREGRTLHYEVPVRMHHPRDTTVLTAGDVLPWATRCGLLPQIDAIVAEKALNLIETANVDVCINLSAESMCHPATLGRLAAQLREHPDAARHLWIDLPENAAFHHAEDFRRLCAELRPLGCRIGLEHVSQMVCRMGELHDVGLDYLKISAGAIRGIDHNPGNQAFLRGLVSIGHTMGMAVVAEGVSDENEAAQVIELGFDGLTGPGVR